LIHLANGALGEAMLLQLELLDAFKLLVCAALLLVGDDDCLSGGKRWRKIFAFLIHSLLSELTLLRYIN